MPNSKELLDEVVNKIRLNESPEEIRSIALLMLESELGLTRTQILSGTSVKQFISSSRNSMIHRINQGEPIQYVLGKASFYAREFDVNPDVLIPRPETELLVQEVIDAHFVNPRILDVGTGSGCIAITLALEIKQATVFGLDSSEPALATARQNAKRLNASVAFLNVDILRDTPDLNGVDIMVSNPPYVMESERESMSPTVLHYEPKLALFVPDHDPLIYYREISARGLSILNPRGKLFFEINARLGKATVQLITDQGYREVRTIPDLDGRDRMLVATRPDR